MTLLSLSMRQLGLTLSISWMLGVAPINMVPKCRVNKTMIQVWDMSRAREWRALASQDVLGRSVLQAVCISTHLSIVCAPLGLFITIRDPLQATCQTVGLRTMPAETRIARSHSVCCSVLRTEQAFGVLYASACGTTEALEVMQSTYEIDCRKDVLHKSTE